MTRRWNPKAWLPPRARNREPADLLVDSLEVLKDLYPAGNKVRPPWARAAVERGWMTWSAYWALPRKEWVPSNPLPKLRYDDAPFFGLLRKSESFGASQVSA